MYFCIMYFWVMNFSVQLFLYCCNFFFFLSYIFVLFRYFVRFLLCGLSVSPSQKIFRVRALPSQHFYFFCSFVISYLYFLFSIIFLLCFFRVASLSPSQKIFQVIALSNLSSHVAQIAYCIPPEVRFVTAGRSVTFLPAV